MKRPSEGSRSARVGERIRQELMEMLLRGAIKDPAVEGVVVHSVDVSGDLRLARVFVRHTMPGSDARTQKRVLSGLTRASGFIRREVGARLSIRYTPELSFFWDDTAERVNRVEAILAEIRNEDEEE